MGLTVKQRDLMTVIFTGNADGSKLDIDQILENISYDTTKQSLQFSLRALSKKGCIQKMPKEIRRGRGRVVYALTTHGEGFFVSRRRDASIDEEIDAPDVDTDIVLPSVFLGLGVEPE